MGMERGRERRGTTRHKSLDRVFPFVFRSLERFDSTAICCKGCLAKSAKDIEPSVASSNPTKPPVVLAALLWCGL